MCRLTTLFILVYFQFTAAVILLKKPDGSIDVDGLENELNLLQQTLIQLQGNQMSQLSEIATLKTEVSNLESEKRSLQNEVRILKSQVGVAPSSPAPKLNEVITLKHEVAALQTKSKIMSRIVTSLDSSLPDLKRRILNLQSSVNKTEAVMTKCEMNCSKTGHSSTKATCGLKEALGSVVAEIQKMKMMDVLNGFYFKTVNARLAQLSTMLNIPSGNGNVAFGAYEDADQTVTQSNSIPRFTKVSYSIGRGYNASTGKFVAPTNGTFIFWTQVETMNYNAVVTIKPKQVYATPATVTSRTHRYMGSMVYFASALHVYKLNLGDEVYVSVENMTDSVYTDDHIPWFMGMLLFH